MAKLYFRYGAMNAAKTLNLLAVAHNYKQQGKRIMLLKPALDDRFGRDDIVSRSGLRMRADLLVDETTRLDAPALRELDGILADEVQFFPVAVIEQLRFITIHLDVPVLCYGLRTDFRSRAFPASLRLLELADSIEEVKVTCHDCDRKAVFNLRTEHGRARLDGPSVVLGDALYVAVCGRHYLERLGREGLHPWASPHLTPDED